MIINIKNDAMLGRNNDNVYEIKFNLMQKQIEHLQKENKQLKEDVFKFVNDINKLQKALNEENFQCSKYAIENEQLKEEYSRLEEKYLHNVPCCNENDCGLYEDYMKLKANWNKLKDYLFDIRKRGIALQNLANVIKNTEPNIGILIIINKMQEIEQESDSNE